MSLEPKKKVLENQKEVASEMRQLRESYKEMVKTDAGKDLIGYLSARAQEYLTRAMSEVDRDRKATLVDTAAGAMLGFNRITEMSKADSKRRVQKNQKSDSKKSVS